MSPRSTFRDRLFERWLPIALTLTLGVAAVLVGFGLLQELTSAQTTVVAAQQPDAIRSTPADDDDDAAADQTHLTPTATEPARLPAAVVPPSPAPALAAASPEPVAVASPSPEPVAGRVRPTPGPRGAPRATADLPIVMYHHIGPLPPNPDIFRRDLTVSPELFEQTLDYLAEHEIETVTMADLFEHFAGGPPLPKKAIVLTFDDGYDDVYEHAFRLLKARGMVGTFFITTDFVEGSGYLTWAQVMEMGAAGMEIGAHSLNHADFTTLGPNELRRQLHDPKVILEHHIGRPVRFMAYPAGKYNAAVMAATRAAGYEAAVTVIHGTKHAPAGAMELRRVRAHGADTLPQITSRFTPAAWP